MEIGIGAFFYTQIIIELHSSYICSGGTNILQGNRIQFRGDQPLAGISAELLVEIQGRAFV